MGDLISRSALLKEFEEMNAKGTSDLWHITGIKALIENQPTAYDVEQVVKELKEKSFPDFEEEYTCNGEPLLYLAETIDIVKGGGVNERD